MQLLETNMCLDTTHNILITTLKHSIQSNLLESGTFNGSLMSMKLIDTLFETVKYLKQKEYADLKKLMALHT